MSSLSRLLSLFAALVLGVLLTGCAGQQVITETPTVEGADDQQATCKVAKDPLNPLIVEWPGTSKVDLDSASQHGIVVVSYAGCTLKVLTSCEAVGEYTLTKVTPARDKLQISDQNDLYARLPLGAASLKGELSLGSSLELDYIAVGQRLAEKPPRNIKGDCEGATHYVRTITVGAYSLDAKAKGKAGASAEIGTAGGGIGREETSRRLRGSGDVEACSKSPDGTECGAVLQLGLAPLNTKGGGQLMASAGFGANVGPLGEIPTVEELPDIGSVGAASLKTVDVDYLNIVQDARRADRLKSMSAADKVAAWERVRDARPKGAYREIAEERALAWAEVMVAEERRREQLEKLRSQYVEDKSKLDQLLRMDDDIVARDQKMAYREEFDAVYGPYKKDLAELGLFGTAGMPGGDNVSRALGKEERGLAGWGHLTAEIDFGYFGQSSQIRLEDSSSDADSEDTSLHGSYNFILGVVLGLTDIIPGGFGFYGTFRATPIAPQSIFAGGGVRWDYMISERGAVNIGAGATYGKYVADTPIVVVDPDGGDDDTINVAPASVNFDAFVGIGYNNGSLSIGGRGWFYVGKTLLEVEGYDVFTSTPFGGGIGGAFGLIL